MKIIRLALSFILATGLIGCGGDNSENVDEQSPSISLTTPTDNMEVSASNNLTVEATVSDNTDLQSCSITIVPLSDGTKGDPAFSYDSRQDDGFPKVSSDFTKGNFVVNYQINIEEAAAQEYEFIIEAVDSEGNTSQKQVYINITRS